MQDPKTSRRLGLSGRLIAATLLAFPEPFRESYGRDILLSFCDQRDEASASARNAIGAWLFVVGTTLKVSFQLIRAGYAERRASLSAKTSKFPKRDKVMFENLFSDLNYAFRGYLKNPGFAATALLTLALGVGACTAVFSVVNGILLTPLPYDDPLELVSIRVNSGIGGNNDFYGTSEPEYWDLRYATNSFQDVGAVSGREVTIGDSTGTRRVRVIRATANTLPMLGVNPAMGRFLTEEEDMPGASSGIILSYGMWQGDFGGVPDILDRVLHVDGLDQPLPVVGVMPAGFEFPDDSWDAWTTLQLDRDDPWARNNHYMDVLARLRPEVSIEEAQAEMNVLAARSTADYPEYYPGPGYRIRLDSAKGLMTSEVRLPLLVLMGAVGFVVLMACVNVASLLLAKGEARKREFAVRNAVGASGRRLTTQLVTENFLLAGIGGAVGLGAAFAITKGLVAIAPTDIPRIGEVKIDSAVLGFSLAVALGTGVLFGIMPALQAARSDIQEVLKEGGGSRGATRSGQSIRRILVGVQITLAVVLASGAGLMLRSVFNMYQVDPGFKTENLVTLRLDPSRSKYNSGEMLVAFYDELTDRVKALPGVQSAGAVFALPMTSGTNNWSILIEGQTAETIGDAPAARIQICTPGYFEALGLSLVRGRVFDENDVAGSTPVVLVSETMARAHWPNQDPIGQRMKVWDEDWPWLEVIGIVKDVYHRGVDREPRTWWYVPHAQGYATAYFSPSNMFLTVQSNIETQSMVTALRSTIEDFDSSVPISRIRTMEQIFAQSMEAQRFVTVLLLAFGFVALGLAAVGVYGVIAYAVSLRTHEIGLRMALGASGANILTQVVREGLLIAVVGLLVGLAGSLALSRSFETMVFGIAPIDPITYSAVIGVLLVVAAGASVLPALKASRVDPMTAFRIEN